MSAHADDLRKWRMLARVRELRVRRCQQMLGRKQRAVHDARMELESRGAMRECHAACLPELMSRCEPGDRDVMPWRQALTLHRLRDEALLGDIQTARRRLAEVLQEAAAAGAALRREMHARDLALAREREEGIRSHDEPEQ